MNLPDWRGFAFDDGILPEPISEGNRLVVWLPADRDQNFQYWERVGIVARAEVAVEEGLCTTSATSIRARQELGRGVGQLWRRLRKPKGSRDYLLPNGTSGEQCGERQTDLVLVWTEGNDSPLEEARVKSHWPEGPLPETRQQPVSGLRSRSQSRRRRRGTGTAAAFCIATVQPARACRAVAERRTPGRRPRQGTLGLDRSGCDPPERG